MTAKSAKNAKNAKNAKEMKISFLSLLAFLASWRFFSLLSLVFSLAYGAGAVASRRFRTASLCSSRLSLNRWRPPPAATK